MNIDIGIRVGKVRATFYRDIVGEPRFEHDPKGHNCLIIPAYDYGDLIDLVAWRIDRPDWFGSLEGVAFALGQDKIDNPGTYALDKSLIVHRTPEAWLRHGQSGICILQHRIAHARLKWVPTITAENVRHGEYLKTLIQPPLPDTRILVPENIEQRGLAA